MGSVRDPKDRFRGGDGDFDFEKKKGGPATEVTRQHVAHHEAGHALAHMRGGLGTRLISIVPDEQKGTLGRAGSLDGESAGGNAWEACMLALFAGYAAQVRFDPSCEALARRGARSDFEKAQELAGVGTNEWATTQAEWLERASAFVADEGNWRAIQLLAAELLEHEDLDPDIAITVVEVADGTTTREQLEWLRRRIEAHRAESFGSEKRPVRRGGK
jgi:hypothetical protein